jgi:hypothetical protein
MLKKCEMINEGVEQRLSLVHPEMSVTGMETALRQKRRRNYTSQPVHNHWKIQFLRCLKIDHLSLRFYMPRECEKVIYL